MIRSLGGALPTGERGKTILFCTRLQNDVEFALNKMEVKVSSSLLTIGMCCMYDRKKSSKGSSALSSTMSMT